MPLAWSQTPKAPCSINPASISGHGELLQMSDPETWSPSLPPPLQLHFPLTLQILLKGLHLQEDLHDYPSPSQTFV